MELQQGGESAYEDPGRQEDKREQVQYAHQPYRPDYQQPFPPGAQQFGGQQFGGQPWGPPQQQWNPAFAPRGQSRTGQNLLIGLGALMIALIVFVAVSVIAHMDQDTRTASSSDSQANGNNTPDANTPTGTQTAEVGSVITLAGLAAGEQLSVTVTKVYNEAQPIDQYNKAPGGERLYAVVFRLKNTGTAGYSDAPGNMALVFDSTGQSYPTEFDDVTECPSFPAVINIPAGASSAGCIAYEVPIDSKITMVQVILDSGYGPQTGDWKVGKAEQ
jgi:hypothetical protein